MSLKARKTLQHKLLEAQKWEREHRLLWASNPTGFVSLDDIDVQAELGIAECDPEYLLMQEREPVLEDWLVGIDCDSVAAEPQSLIDTFNSFFN